MEARIRELERDISLRKADMYLRWYSAVRIERDALSAKVRDMASVAAYGRTHDEQRSLCAGEDLRFIMPVVFGVAR